MLRKHYLDQCQIPQGINSHGGRSGNTWFGSIPEFNRHWLRVILCFTDRPRHGGLLQRRLRTYTTGDCSIVVVHLPYQHYQKAMLYVSIYDILVLYIDKFSKRGTHKWYPALRTFQTILFRQKAYASFSYSGIALVEMTKAKVRIFLQVMNSLCVKL